MIERDPHLDPHPMNSGCREQLHETTLIKFNTEIWVIDADISDVRVIGPGRENNASVESKKLD